MCVCVCESSSGPKVPQVPSTQARGGLTAGLPDKGKTLIGVSGLLGAVSESEQLSAPAL